MQNNPAAFFLPVLQTGPRTARIVALSAALVSLAACSKKEIPKTPGQKPAQCKNIPNTPLCWQIPQGWHIMASAQKADSKAIKSAIEKKGTDAATETQKSAITSKILNTHLVVSGSKKTAQTRLVTPTVEIYTSDLRPDTSATDFLAENRLSQQKAMSAAHIRHLEVEPVRHNQRHGFIVRDAFDVLLPKGKKVSVGQQALLLVDKNKGYVLVVTMAQDQLKQELADLHRWLDSVQFTK